LSVKTTAGVSDGFCGDVRILVVNRGVNAEMTACMGQLNEPVKCFVCYHFCVCVACSPEFRFGDHIENAALDAEQPKKMLLKRDPDTYEVCDWQMSVNVV